MMNGLEKSDPAIVAMKPANKAGQPAAEWVEPRAGTKGNTGQPRTRRTQSRCSVSPGLDRVREVARQRKKERFTALLHHVTIDLLRDAFVALKRHAAPGVDGVTWQDYEANIEGNLRDLHSRVQRGTYRAQPVRRRFIPKADGKQRPLGVTAMEDKIVQRAVATVLNEIYEEDFLGFSYGFRPGRSQHDALDALAVGIHVAHVNWILDADIRSYFDKQRGLGKPETFTFLGFIFICGKSRYGAFQLQRRSRGDRMRATLQEIKAQLRKRMPDPIPSQGRWLRLVVQGYLAYHAVPTNMRAIAAFRYHVTDLWRRALRRRSQKDAMTWKRMTKLAEDWLPPPPPPPRILHPWPDKRFDVKYPRWEPSA